MINRWVLGMMGSFVQIFLPYIAHKFIYVKHKVPVPFFSFKIKGRVTLKSVSSESVYNSLVDNPPPVDSLQQSHQSLSYQSSCHA
jgi:hypothetical protein